MPSPKWRRRYPQPDSHREGFQRPILDEDDLVLEQPGAINDKAVVMEEAE